MAMHFLWTMFQRRGIHLPKSVGGGIKAYNARMPAWLFESLKQSIRQKDQIKTMRKQITLKQNDHAMSSIRMQASGIEEGQKR